jgi:perosamine synthetase
MTSSDNSSHLTSLKLSGTGQLEQDRLDAAELLATYNQAPDACTADLEERVRIYTGSQFAIAASLGSVALHLCLQALGIQAGDLVITTPYAGNTPIQVLLAGGVIPVFVDVEPRTGNIDAHLVYAAAQDINYGGKNAQAWLPPKGAGADARLKAILPVDVLGQTTDLEPILNTAWKYRIKVIEDAAETLGTAYKGRPAGALADFAVLGFHTDHQDSNPAAGVLVTDEIQPAQQISSLRDNVQRPPDLSRQDADGLHSHRPDPLAAAFGLIHLRHLEERASRRKQVADWYDQYLAGIPGIETPLVAGYTSQMGWPVYVIRLATDLDRDGVLKKLVEQDIPARAYHLPLHLQSYIVDRFGYQPGTFPVTEDLGRRSLALPISSTMEQGHVEQVCQALARSI